MRPLAILALTASLVPAASCSETACDCAGPVLGLVLTTDAPITQIALAGSACDGARFRCLPADFDNTLSPYCTRLQIEAKAPGACVVDLSVGTISMRVERQMIVYPGCCGTSPFIGEENGLGEIDLRQPADAGVD